MPTGGGIWEERWQTNHGTQITIHLVHDQVNLLKFVVHNRDNVIQRDYILMVKEAEGLYLPEQADDCSNPAITEAN